MRCSGQGVNSLLRSDTTLLSGQCMYMVTNEAMTKFNKNPQNIIKMLNRVFFRRIKPSNKMQTQTFVKKSQSKSLIYPPLSIFQLVIWILGKSIYLAVCISKTRQIACQLGPAP